MKDFKIQPPFAEKKRRKKKNLETSEFCPFLKCVTPTPNRLPTMKKNKKSNQTKINKVNRPMTYNVSFKILASRGWMQYGKINIFDLDLTVKTVNGPVLKKEEEKSFSLNAWKSATILHFEKIQLIPPEIEYKVVIKWYDIVTVKHPSGYLYVWNIVNCGNVGFKNVNASKDKFAQWYIVPISTPYNPVVATWGDEFALVSVGFEDHKAYVICNTTTGTGVGKCKVNLKTIAFSPFNINPNICVGNEYLTMKAYPTNILPNEWPPKVNRCEGGIPNVEKVTTCDYKGWEIVPKRGKIPNENGNVKCTCP